MTKDDRDVVTTAVDTIHVTCREAMHQRLALEERLTAVRAEADGLQKAHEKASQERDAAAKERDELRAALGQRDEDLARVAKERDELRGKLEGTKPAPAEEARAEPVDA